MRFVRLLLLAAAACGPAVPARADVKPHPLFTDNMVLQQGVPIPVWGKADPGESFRVALSRKSGLGEQVAASFVKADEKGDWKIVLPAQTAGTGVVLKIGQVELKNVAVGEVWVCSGQSNMEWSVNISETPDKIKAGAKHPEIRLFTVQKRTAAAPITDQGDLRHFTKWVECSPETVGGFSAVAYHFGVKLQKELGVPVGLIHTSWGGTPAQAWASLGAMEAEPALKHYGNGYRTAVKNFEEAKKNYDPAKAKAAHEAALEKWKEAAEKAKAEGKPEPKRPALQQAPTALGPNVPGTLYNAMIHPLLPFAVRGAIWYQGESNAGAAYEYRTLLPTMIQDWRKKWGHEFPFMVVQLAPFWNGNSDDVHYAELRDAQLHTAKTLPKVGLAVITDVGDEKDIHPKPKQPVGERLAVAALGIEYGKKITYSGPVYKDGSLKVEGDKAVLSFDHVGGGLTARGGELHGFAVAGEDKVFHPAKAEIKGDTVVVTSDKVTKPVAVRYGWVNFAKPTLNFFNKEGLPATPFRTDDFPMKTGPKK